MFFFLGLSLDFAQNSVIEIGEPEAAEHRIGDRGPIYTNMGHEHFIAAFEFIVGTDGKAVSVQETSGFIGDMTLLARLGSTSLLSETVIL